MISDEELDNVAGGTRIETFMDGDELHKRGLLNTEESLDSESVRKKLHELGYTGYKDNGGFTKANVYTDREGNMITREEFWKNFNAEDGIGITPGNKNKIF